MGRQLYNGVTVVPHPHVVVLSDFPVSCYKVFTLQVTSVGLK